MICSALVGFVGKAHPNRIRLSYFLRYSMIANVQASLDFLSFQFLNIN